MREQLKRALADERRDRFAESAQSVFWRGAENGRQGQVIELFPRPTPALDPDASYLPDLF
jgi:hypothetical protein